MEILDGINRIEAEVGGRPLYLFSGDCLQGSVYLGLDGTPKLCPTYTHVDPYLETAAAIDSLAPAELHGCHWPARRGREVAAFIGESRAYVERIDGLVSAAVGDQPRTLRALIAQVNERGRATADRDANGHVVYRSAE
jgi:hypothetical protein